jgi:hypothetical protein
MPYMTLNFKAYTYVCQELLFMYQELLFRIKILSD